MEKEKKWLTYDSTIGEFPKVREDVISMVNRWLDKGVDGFRMDVINYISKEEGLWKIAYDTEGRKKPDSQTGNAGGRNKAKNGILKGYGARILMRVK